MTTKIDIDALIEDEWYTVRYSGEIPEVAYHGALFHLTEEQDGPRIELQNDHKELLLEAVTQRYLDITLRDLLPENKNTGAYRGIKRSFVNWQRFVLFCKRHDIEGTRHRETIGAAFVECVQHEVGLAEKEKSPAEFNCSFSELHRFAELLGLQPTAIPGSAQHYCLGD